MGVEGHYHSAQSLGASGRRGDAQDTAQAEAILSSDAAHDGDPTYPSFNHLTEGRSTVSIVRGETETIDLVEKHTRGEDCGDALPNQGPGGIEEAGPLYGGRGHAQPIQQMGICAHLDGKIDVRDRCRAMVRRFVGHHVASMVWVRPKGRIKGHDGPNGITTGDRDIQGGGNGWANGQGGSRAHYGPGWGWPAEDPLSEWLQVVLDFPGRRLSPRFANYKIGDNTWDGWCRVTATLLGLVPGNATAAQLATAFETKAIPPEHSGFTAEEVGWLREFVQSGGAEHAEWVRGLSQGLMIRFDVDVIRLVGGDVLVVYSATTSGPKVMVAWCYYDASERLYLLCAPCEYGGNKRGDGVGYLREKSPGVWCAVGESESENTRIESPSFRDSDVVSHWHYEDKTLGGWKLGELDPDEEGGGEPPPPGESPVARFSKSRRGPKKVRVKNRSLNSQGPPADRVKWGDGKAQNIKPGEVREHEYDHHGTYEIALVAKRGDLEDTKVKVFETRPLIVDGGKADDGDLP